LGLLAGFARLKPHRPQLIWFMIRRLPKLQLTFFIPFRIAARNPYNPGWRATAESEVNTF
jgi:hypothetical protein